MVAADRRNQPNGGPMTQEQYDPNETLRRQNVEILRMLASIQSQFAHPQRRSRPKRHSDGAVQSELQVTNSGRLRLMLSKEQRAFVWRAFKVAVAVTLGAAGVQAWPQLSAWIASVR